MTQAILRCTPSDAEHVTGVVRRAFQDNPVIGWLSQDMHEHVDRDRLFHEYFRVFADHALSAGVVDATADGAAVALWLLPEDEGPADYEERMASITGEHYPRFEILDAKMHAAHPGTGVHHLAFLAVEPGTQSQGHGSRLVRHHHATLDENGLPSYLEASAPRNRALYERMGYSLTGATIDLPDGPSMWPMMKPPA